MIHVHGTLENINNYMDAVGDVGAIEYEKIEGFIVEYVDGRPFVYMMLKGKKVLVVHQFAVINTKIDTEDGYCLDARQYYADSEWVDSLPKAEDFDLVGIDAIPESWLPVEEV